MRRTVMSYLLIMLAVLAVGTAILVGGMVLADRDAENSPYGFRTSFKTCIGWGLGFFVSLASEFTLLAYL
jgi:uncharacterized membrane protein YhiD involved in acid resistance